MKKANMKLYHYLWTVFMLTVAIHLLMLQLLSFTLLFNFKSTHNICYHLADNQMFSIPQMQVLQCEITNNKNLRVLHYIFYTQMNCFGIYDCNFSNIQNNAFVTPFCLKEKLALIQQKTSICCFAIDLKR